MRIDSLDDAVPPMSSVGRTVCCLSLQANLIPGEFVLLSNNQKGQIVDIADSFDSIPIEQHPQVPSPNAMADNSLHCHGWFVLLQRYVSPSDDEGAAVVPPPINFWRHMCASGVAELTVTSELVWAPALLLEDVVFVFHIESVSNQQHACNGMSRAYLIRCALGFGRHRDNVDLVDASLDEHDPFFIRGKAESCSQRMWKMLRGVHQAMCKGMNTASTYQRPSKKVHAHVTLEGWFFIVKSLCGKENGPVELRDSRRCHDKILRPDLSKETMRFKRESNCMRVLNSVEMSVVRSLFGNAFAIAVRKPAPRVSDLTSSTRLMNSDGVNATFCEDGNNQQQMTDRFVCRIDQKGIDFVCNKSDRGNVMMEITLRFASLLGNNPLLDSVQLMPNDGDIHNSNLIVVEPGLFFHQGGVSCFVVAVERGRVTVKNALTRQVLE